MFKTTCPSCNAVQLNPPSQVRRGIVCKSCGHAIQLQKPEVVASQTTQEKAPASSVVSRVRSAMSRPVLIASASAVLILFVAGHFFIFRFWFTDADSDPGQEQLALDHPVTHTAASVTAEDFFQSGMKFLEEENWFGARTAFGLALEADPSHEGAQNALDELKESLNRSGEGLEELEEDLDKSTTTDIGPISSHLDVDAIRGAMTLVAWGMELTDFGGNTYVQKLATGSGFSISSSGLVLTNAHVVHDYMNAMNVRDIFAWAAYQALTAEGNASYSPDEMDAKRNLIASKYSNIRPAIWLFFGDRSEPVEAEVEYISDYDAADVAVLKCSRMGKPYFHLSLDQDELSDRNGSAVWAFGYPAAAQGGVTKEEIFQDFVRREIANPARLGEDALLIESPRHFFAQNQREHTTTKGVFSRLITQDENGMLFARIEHDAQIGHGSSGGPLLTEEACVLGINTWVAGQDSDDQGYANAVSLAHLTDLLQDYVPMTPCQ